MRGQLAIKAMADRHRGHGEPERCKRRGFARRRHRRATGHRGDGRPAPPQRSGRAGRRGDLARLPAPARHPLGTSASGLGTPDPDRLVGHDAQELLQRTGPREAAAVRDLRRTGRGQARRAASASRGPGLAVRRPPRPGVSHQARRPRSGRQPDAGLGGVRLPHPAPAPRPRRPPGAPRGPSRPKAPTAPRLLRLAGAPPGGRAALRRRRGAFRRRRAHRPVPRRRAPAQPAHPPALVHRGALARPGGRAAGAPIGAAAESGTVSRLGPAARRRSRGPGPRSAPGRRLPGSGAGRRRWQGRTGR